MKIISFKSIVGLACCLASFCLLFNSAYAAVIYEWHLLDTYSQNDGWGADIGDMSASFVFDDSAVNKGRVQLTSDMGDLTPLEDWPVPEAIIDFAIEYTINGEKTTYGKRNLDIQFNRDDSWREAYWNDVVFSEDRETFFFDFRVFQEQFLFYPDPGYADNFAVFSIWSADFFIQGSNDFFHGVWERKQNYDPVPVPEPNTIYFFWVSLGSLLFANISWTYKRV